MSENTALNFEDEIAFLEETRVKIDTCPKHKIKMKLELVQTGGCHGHSGEDDRCYCDSPDVHAELYCPGVNDKGCKHRVKIVPGLTDVHSIERWITERYA